MLFGVQQPMTVHMDMCSTLWVFFALLPSDPRLYIFTGLIWSSNFLLATLLSCHLATLLSTYFPNDYWDALSTEGHQITTKLVGNVQYLYFRAKSSQTQTISVLHEERMFPFLWPAQLTSASVRFLWFHHQMCGSVIRCYTGIRLVAS